MFGNFIDSPDAHKREAMFYTNTARGIKCSLCPNECSLKPGDISTCHSRICENNKLYTFGYGNPCGVNVDPVEKKPLYHFHPGSEAFSIGVAGCNFACLNCLNWEISQRGPGKTKNYELMPEALINQCLNRHSLSIAYTYTEPTTFFEYMYDTATLAHEKNLKNIYVSNGYINEPPLRKLCKVIDAASVDIKAFNDTTYQKLTAGSLQPVLNSVKIMKAEGICLEISNLIVPGWTDDLNMIRQMCDWLAANGFSDQPFHFIRFFPMYKLTNLQPTPFETLQKAREIAVKAGLKYVYIGNVPGEETENTICPRCKQILVKRKGFHVVQNLVSQGKCKWCNQRVSGVWDN